MVCFYEEKKNSFSFFVAIMFEWRDIIFDDVLCTNLNKIADEKALRKYQGP